MPKDSISIKNIKGISNLEVDFNYPKSRMIVITGKNGTGKTTVIKAFKLISDIQIYQISSAENSLSPESIVSFSLDGYAPFNFTYEAKVKALDTKDELPGEGRVVAELPIPYGQRFLHFSLVAANDQGLRANIASSDYRPAKELIDFLKSVYSTDKYDRLLSTSVSGREFYFFLLNDDYYLREDHFSSGEYFLIQIYRLLTSGADIVVIDELDVALDASAQTRLFASFKPILKKYNVRMLLISHSLAFMETVDDGGLYYLEATDNAISLAQRSFGYIKSDLYGFYGKERFILTEDKVLSGFIHYIIKTQIAYFFEYEIIEVGGHPQIDSMAAKNDSSQIFGDSHQVLIVTDKDIFNKLKYEGPIRKYCTPVDDIEFFIWSNRHELLKDINIKEFKASKKDKDTAKTYWKN